MKLLNERNRTTNNDTSNEVEGKAGSRARVPQVISMKIFFVCYFCDWVTGGCSAWYTNANKEDSESSPAVLSGLVQAS